MKILVTGGAGFIGSAVIRYLVNKSISVVNLDKLTYAGNLQSLADVQHSPLYNFEKIDICNEQELERVFYKHQPDIVMHLAAESHVERSIDGPKHFVHTNLVGTFNLLDVSRKYYDSLDDVKKIFFVFIIFLPMKFMVICLTLIRCLQN